MRKVSGRNTKYRAPAIATKTNIPANKTNSELRVRCRRRCCALLECSIGSGAGIGSENRVVKVSAPNALAKVCVADHGARDFRHRHPPFYAVSLAGGTVIANVADRAKARTRINLFSGYPAPRQRTPGAASGRGTNGKTALFGFVPPIVDGAGGTGRPRRSS